METQRFYDDLAPYYDLIFEDWDASMARQGDAITSLIESELGAPAGSPGARRVLDAACGIGTQALALAARGFQVSGRDLAPAAVARLEREALSRHLIIDAGVADMRALAATVTAPFDAVIAFDNSIPHLLTDGDILSALGELKRVLRPGGVCLCSVRDYDLVERGGLRLTPMESGCVGARPSGCARSGPGKINCTIRSQWSSSGATPQAPPASCKRPRVTTPFRWPGFSI